MGEIELEPPPLISKPDTTRRWPAEFALLTAWLLPATTARRTQHVSLRRAFAVHLMGAALATMLFLVMVSWADSTTYVTSSRAFARLCRGLANELQHDPEEFFLAVTGGGLGIELGFIALAFLIVAWGARVEALRASFAHALRRTWLQTGHAIPAILLVGVLAVHFDHARRDWLRQNPFPYFSTMKPQPPTQPATSQAWEAYSQARQAHVNYYNKHSEEIRWKYRQRQPWPVRYGEIFTVTTGFIFGAWIIWAWLRSVGVPRSTPQLISAPLCEFCGYNLTTATAEGRCPECGELVITSLGPQARQGTAWQLRQRGKLRGYCRSTLDAIFQPAELGRQIRLYSPGTEHRWFVALNILPVFFLAMIAFPLGVIFYYSEPIRLDMEIVYLGGPVMGFVAAIASIVLPLLISGLFGLFFYQVDKRNLMPAIIQIASYLSGYVMFMIVFACLSAITVGYLEDRLKILAAFLSLSFYDMRACAWLLPNLVCWAMYCRLLWRGISAARYANS